MTDQPLKPLIRGMFVMTLVAAAALFIRSLRQELVEEMRQLEADENARQEQRRDEQQAADRRTMEEAARSSPGRRLDRATLEAIQAKKRPLDVGARFGLIRRQAEQGDPNSQHLLGRIYLRGMDDVLQVNPSTYGLSYSLPAAAALTGVANFSKSADDLNFINLPRIPEDTHEAARWYERAARQGHREAQSSLAYLYYYMPDYVLGYKWALISDGQPVLPEELKLESHTSDWRKAMREELAEKLTPVQKGAAERLAEGFRPQKEIR